MEENDALFMNDLINKIVFISLTFHKKINLKHEFSTKKWIVISTISGWENWNNSKIVVEIIQTTY